MRHFYGFRYWSGPQTTTGQPNKITGRLSIAGTPVVYTTLKQLQQWIDEGDLYKSSGLGGGRREKVTKADLRRLCLGNSLEEFKAMLELLQSEAMGEL